MINVASMEEWICRLNALNSAFRFPKIELHIDLMRTIIKETTCEISQLLQFCWEICFKNVPPLQCPTFWDRSCICAFLRERIASFCWHSQGQALRCPRNSTECSGHLGLSSARTLKLKTSLITQSKIKWSSFIIFGNAINWRLYHGGLKN